MTLQRMQRGTADMARFSLSQQIEEVGDMLRRCETEYPVLVAKRKLGASISQYRLDRLRAALHTLIWVAKHEKTIRERCPDLFPGEGR